MRVHPQLWSAVAGAMLVGALLALAVLRYVRRWPQRSRGQRGRRGLALLLFAVGYGLNVYALADRTPDARRAAGGRRQPAMAGHAAGHRRHQRHPRRKSARRCPADGRGRRPGERPSPPSGRPAGRLRRGQRAGVGSASRRAFRAPDRRRCLRAVARPARCRRRARQPRRLVRTRANRSHAGSRRVYRALEPTRREGPPRWRLRDRRARRRHHRECQLRARAGGRTCPRHHCAESFARSVPGATGGTGADAGGPHALRSGERPVPRPSRHAHPLGQRYACGRADEGGKILYTTAGIGTSLLPVRFGNPPESSS